jgi:hypothetical protein
MSIAHTWFGRVISIPHSYRMHFGRDALGARLSTHDRIGILPRGT